MTRQKTLRKLVGIRCIASIDFIFFVRWSTGYTSTLSLMSHYYYTRLGSLLIIIVSLLAILSIYNGKELIDFILSTIACTGALLLLPTSNITEPGLPKEVIVSHLSKNSLREGIHYGSAALFLL